MTTEQTMMNAGGKRLMAGPDEIWYFGWNPPEPGDPTHEVVRTAANVQPEEDAANKGILCGLPAFEITGNDQGNTEKVCLFDLWKHPEVVAANGREFTGIWQRTGSCVGAGGGVVMATLSFVEVIRLGDPEQALVPFWLLPYGRSRFHAGMRGQGEGSYGSAFAKAMMEDGIVPANLPDLPQPEMGEGMLTWGRSAEMTWSAGDRISAAWLEKSRKHPAKTVAKLSNADQTRDSVRNGFSVTCASMYAHDGGTVQGTPPVLLGRRRGQWAHQMSIMAWWNHPTLGELFYLFNQWGQYAHGTCPSGAPRGGVWITKADMDWICKDEVFAFSQFQGFPATTFNWNNM